MKGLRTIISVAALAALVAVLPAAAQSGSGGLANSGYTAPPGPEQRAPGVPEPGALAMLAGAAGGGALALVRRLRR